MKKINLFTTATAFLVLTIGCSPSHSPQNATALPKSWYALPEKNENTDDWTQPSEAADKAVAKTFENHLAILDAAIPPLNSSTPWHLDAMRTDFSVSANGIFGILQLGGTATVRGTWQRAKAITTVSTAKQTISGIHFSGQTSNENLDAIIEPTVRTLVATKSITNVDHFRTELRSKASQFLLLTQSLSSLQPTSDWQVTGAQLQLTVDASGNVTPTVAVGGEVDVYFDWNLTGPVTTPVVNAGLTNELNKLVQFFSKEVTLVVNDNKDLKNSGFQLSDYYVGVEVSASGQVGIASAGAAVTGRLYFTKTPNPSTANASDTSALPVADLSAFPIPEVKFRKGLDHAMSMGAYFVKKASQVKSNQWKLAILETEYDASAGGGFAVASVVGTGSVVMDFTPQN